MGGPIGRQGSRPSRNSYVRHSPAVACKHCLLQLIGSLQLVKDFKIVSMCLQWLRGAGSPLWECQQCWSFIYSLAFCWQLLWEGYYPPLCSFSDISGFALDFTWALKNKKRPLKTWLFWQIKLELGWAGGIKQAIRELRAMRDPLLAQP